MSDETPVKTPGKLVPQPHGGALSPGNPGNKGGGRTPDEFKRWMQQFATSKEAEAGIKEVLATGPKHPAWLGALKHCTEHGYGKPKETKDVNVTHTMTDIERAERLGQLLSIAQKREIAARLES